MVNKWIATGFLFGLMGPQISVAGKLTNLELSHGENSSRVVLTYEGKGSFNVLKSKAASSVVIEAAGINLPARLARRLDSAAVGGPVVQLTPYSAGSPDKPLSKFVLQLRGITETISSEVPGKFVLEVRAQDKIGQAPPNAKLRHVSGRERDEVKSRAASSVSEESAEVARKLVEVLNAPPAEKKYFGDLIESFEGKGVSVHDVFTLIGETAKLNIVSDPGVQGTVNFTLQNVPWDQVLDIALQQNGLRAVVNGGVIRITTQTQVNEENARKLEEISMQDSLEPVVMAVIPMSYAKAEEMMAMLDTLLAKRQAAQAGTGNQDFVRGQIKVDTRSNSLVVTNTADAIERMRRLVKELDIPLPQVLIDSKIILATETFSRNIGVGWSGVATTTGSGRAGAGGGFNMSNGVTIGDPTAASAFTITPGNGSSMFGFRVGAGLHGNLNASLQLAEINGLSKTVASPRVIVNNKVPATVVDGSTLYFPTTSGANSAGTFQEVKASLTMSVTPQVTSGGSVLLNVDIAKDEPGPSAGGAVPSVQNKSLKTEVLVDSGATLVLGGVYQFSATDNEDGIPLLKDLPFLGNLFKTSRNNYTKNELMVFITPQIIDPEADSPMNL
jgi:type IV pilus assembly protein PilQ